LEVGSREEEVPELQEAEVGSRREVLAVEVEAAVVPNLGEAEVVGRMTFFRPITGGIEMVIDDVPFARVATELQISERTQI
jgi:hypothetical protein